MTPERSIARRIALTLLNFAVTALPVTSACP
jgi:hypothetical protein